MKIVRKIQLFGNFLEYLALFIKVSFSKRGLPTKAGRQLIWGKIRRILLTLIPAVAIHFRKKHGLQGQCNQCGASCKILFKCPQWDDKSHLCRVYEDRPSVCRYFPITPADIADRDLILHQPCGFSFSSNKPNAQQKKENLDSTGQDSEERRFPV